MKIQGAIARSSVDGANDLYLVGRGEACSFRNIGHRRTSLLNVGATIGRPRSYRLSLRIRLSSFLLVGVDVLDDPRAYGLPPCIRLSFFDCRGDLRSPVARQKVTFAPTRANTVRPYGRDKDFLFYRIRKFIFNRYDIGQSRTPVPTI